MFFMILSLTKMYLPVGQRCHLEEYGMCGLRWFDGKYSTGLGLVWLGMLHLMKLCI
jgi:hypothetical protein